MGVDLGKGLRKVRMAVTSKGKGKSGGVRIITFLMIKNGDDITIELLDVYDKSETASLSDKELRNLLKRCDLTI